MSYVPLRQLAGELRLSAGENLFVTSDVKQLLYGLIEQGDETDLNILIDGMIECLGPGGTLVFPTFNWAFCKGTAYDHYKTPCKTGSLGKIALSRGDFRRTKHPIYSFAVWGKGAEELCAIENKSSFGADSPFTYFMNHHFQNLFIDKDLQHSFVFVHYVEENNGPVPYRYLKDFTAPYTDENGVTSERTYSMNVRELSMNVENRIYPYEPDFLKAGVMEVFQVNGIEYKIIDLKGAYPIIAEDVLHNRSRKLCSYIGQEDEA
ncbi:MAG: AAC(3) family N-acetyltransferase [Lachnospiraceae bacterium]|nr:AAC(3) family N-acetyltransferase [Lachnospiraceae bacterium]